MNESELKEVLRLHKMWLDLEPDGKRADLREEDLRGADLSNANLCDANLCGADLGKANLSNANLCGANLRSADLSHANLNDANLCGADLSNADMVDADLRGADLSGADLSYANLRSADLSYVNLNDANLCGVDLCGADLNGAKCGYEAFFGRSIGAPIYQTVRGFGSRDATLTLLAQGERQEWRWFTGCFEGSEEELRAAVAVKHGNSKAGKGYLLAIDYLAAQAELNARNSY